MNVGSLERRAIPVLLGIAAAAFLAVWLARWLGGFSLPLATGLWGVALAGLAYSNGGLLWADRYPTLSRLFESYAPALVGRDAAIAPAVFTRAARPEAPTAAPPPPQNVDISHMLGLEDVLVEVEALVGDTAMLVRANAPGICILLAGPPGTGKSTLARYMAMRLHAARIARTAKVVTITDADYKGSSGAPDPVAEKARNGVDGVIIVDDLDEIKGHKAGETSTEIKGITEIGLQLLAVARQYPRRILVIWTGSEEALSALDPRQRWLGKLDAKRIVFPPLSPDTRKKLALRLFEDRGFACAEDAGPELKRRLSELEEDIAEFDNAHAVRRYVESAIEAQKLRLRGDALAKAGMLPLAERSTIRDHDVRKATAKVIR